MKGLILTFERTTFGKKIRKDYEGGRIDIQRKEMRQYTTRMDDCSNTITTILKDNLLLEIWN